MSLESRKNTAMDDPGAELLDKASSLWQHYGRIILGTVVGLAVVGLAAYYVTAGNARKENDASEKLAQANDLFWRADYDRSRQMAQDVAKQFNRGAYDQISGTEVRRTVASRERWASPIRGRQCDRRHGRLLLHKQSAKVVRRTKIQHPRPTRQKRSIS